MTNATKTSVVPLIMFGVILSIFSWQDSTSAQGGLVGGSLSAELSELSVLEAAHQQVVIEWQEAKKETSDSAYDYGVMVEISKDIVKKQRGRVVARYIDSQPSLKSHVDQVKSRIESNRKN